MRDLPPSPRQTKRRTRRTGRRWPFLAVAALLLVLTCIGRGGGEPKEPGGGAASSAACRLSGELRTQLELLVKEELRAEPLLLRWGDYPTQLLELAVRNRETLDFVLDYPEAHESPAAETVGSVQKGSFPLLMQWDPGWGYLEYGDGPMALTGCGPTVLSMVICGLTGDDAVTPYVVAEYARKEGFYVEGTGTSWDLMRLGGEAFGVTSDELPLNEAQVLGALSRGEPVVCSVGPGDFTTSGHFILLVGEEHGRIKVHDPNRMENSQRLWDYDVLASQIRNLWAFSLVEGT